MIRSQLVARVAALNPHLYAREAEAAVDAVLARIADALAAGDRVELRDFGVFEAARHGARRGRNPRTGAAVEVAEKVAVRFKPGRGMRAAQPRRRGPRAGRCPVHDRRAAGVVAVRYRLGPSHNQCATPAN